jgi:uncharacterized damage-inducible protein DinB
VFDPKAIVLKSLTSAFRNFRLDLESLPEDVFARSLGGKARTVADIVYEVNLVNDDIVRNIQGEKPMDWPEGWVTAPPELQAKEAVIAAFDASRDRVMALFESLTSEDMERAVVTEHGRTTPFERGRFIVLHVFYHSGQLNFIQTLLGDDGWHW